MEIYVALLDRIRSALRREQSMSVGIASEIVASTTYMSRLHAEERQAARRAEAWPRNPGFDSLPPEQQNDALIAEADQRRVLRQVQRIAGRPAVTEQSLLRDHVAAAEAAGADPGVAAERFARASASVDPQSLQQAWETAVAARAKAEAALADLEAERVQHGRKAGALRLTLQQAETWLRANGLAIEAAA